MREDRLNHLRPKFWVSDPLELSERRELWEYRAKHT